MRRKGGLKKISGPAKYGAMDGFSLQGLRAMLFDFEGTLVPFEWNIAEAVSEVHEMLGGLGIPAERLQGRSYSALLTEGSAMAHEYGHSPQEVRRRIEKIYDGYDEDALRRWRLRPGARALLDRLKEEGLKTGLVTNVGRKGILKGLAKLSLEKSFEAVVTRNDVRIPKPSGEGIGRALEILQVKKDEAVHVGDSLDDIRAARDSGLSVILFRPAGVREAADFGAVKPDFEINSFEAWVASL